MILVVVTVLTVGASGINFLGQAFLAYRFGAGIETDSYTFSLAIPLFAMGVISTIISYTLVPLIASEGGNAARQTDICTASLRVGVLASAIVASLSVPATVLQPLTLPENSPLFSLGYLHTLILLAWLIAATQITGAVMTAQLNACHRPVIAAALSLIPGLAMVTALALFDSVGVLSAPLGLLAGSMVAALFGLFFQRDRIKLRLRFEDVKPRVPGIMLKSIWAALALSCFSGFMISDAYWASRMPDGSLATLGYAQRLIIGLGGLVVSGPSALFVPRFATLARSGDRVGFQRLLVTTLLAVWGLGACSFSVLILFADEAVAMLFERGAFSSNDTLALANAMSAMAPGAVAMLSVVILMRAVFCLEGTGPAAAVLGIGWCVLYFVLSGLLLELAVVGVAYSYSISWVIFMVAMLIFTLHKLKNIG